MAPHTKDFYSHLHTPSLKTYFVLYSEVGPARPKLLRIAQRGHLYMLTILKEQTALLEFIYIGICILLIVLLEYLTGKNLQLLCWHGPTSYPKYSTLVLML